MGISRDNVAIGLAAAAVLPPSLFALVLMIALAVSDVAGMGSASGMAGGAMMIIFFGTMISGLHALLLGLPLFLVLARRPPIRWWTAAAAGFAVGAIPAGLLFLSGDEAGLGALVPAAITGALGMVGGLAFWAVACRSLPEPDDGRRLSGIFGDA